ncbi:DUF4258 domain-containing protein [Coleofasciculus sp. E2-BRE-01]|uniref:DUF4258 domain-containing protein n=1 Tax=Coleofasciculus sp. E2-BRE-01 TaxID=3069524 RepID=UPI004062BC4C
MKSQLQAGKFEFTRHAFKRAIERNISEAEIREASVTMEVIEDYPDDKYSPSCLLLGFTLLLVGLVRTYLSQPSTYG